MIIPNIWENKNMFQTTNQIRFNNQTTPDHQKKRGTRSEPVGFSKGTELTSGTASQVDKFSPTYLRDSLW